MCLKNRGRRDRLIVARLGLKWYRIPRSFLGDQMIRSTTLTIRLSVELKEFVDGYVGEAGSCESASGYIRDLIRREKERTEREAFERLRGELHYAFGKPSPSY